jgi:hypothetical protein
MEQKSQSPHRSEHDAKVAPGDLAGIPGAIAMLADAVDAMSKAYIAGVQSQGLADHVAELTLEARKLAGVPPTDPAPGQSTAQHPTQELAREQVKAKEEHRS